jgi:hypothetical protein
MYMMTKETKRIKRRKLLWPIVIVGELEAWMSGMSGMSGMMGVFGSGGFFAFSL